MPESHYTNNPLFSELKRYLYLKLDYYRLDTLEKGSLFLGNMLLVLICLLFSCFALLCLSFAIAYLLGSWLGSFVWGFLIIAAVYIVLILSFIKFKEHLLINPMIRILDETLFKKRVNNEKGEL